MRINRSDIAGWSTVEHHRVSRSRLPAPGARSNLPVQARPLDWRLAVRAAAARLNETWGLADATAQPEMMDLAQQLAALLCAYGELPEEVERMEARAGERVAVRRPPAPPHSAMPSARPSRPAGAGFPRLIPRR
jgi:hypothetical protein